MSSIPNYLALYNLSEINADIIIVGDLTATRGTIFTLNSTTGTITTLNTVTGNITTANITTTNTTLLNTNNIQANPNSSDITIYTSHTGAFNLGNTSNTNGIRMNNKLQMATDKQIEITPTGHLACETIRGYSFSNAVSLYLTQTGAISFGNNLGTGGGITINDNTTLPANRTITLNATGGKIVCNNFQGTSVSSVISLFTDTTGASINIGNTSNSNAVGIRQRLIMSADKSILISGTGALRSNLIQAETETNSVTLFNNQTAAISFGNSLGTGAGIIFNDSITIASNRVIYLSSTGGKVYCNVYTGTAVSSNLSIGESGDSGTLTIYKTIAGTLKVNDIQGSTTSASITLFTNSSVSTPTITLGNVSGGTFSINPNTTMNGNLILASNKTITLNATGGQILCDLYTGTATGTAISLFGTSTSTIGLGNLSGGIFSINPNTTMNGNLILASGKTITLNATGGEILCDKYVGTTTGSGISLFGTSTSVIDLGNPSSTSVIRINQNISVAATKILRTPYLYPTSTISDIYIGSQTADTGTLFIEMNTDLHSSKKLKLNNTTALKIVLTDVDKNLISSSWTDTDFARLAANNIFSGSQNSFNKVAINTTTNQADTDLEIWGTNTKMVLYSASSGTPSIDFIRGTRTFGNDGNSDYRLENSGGVFNLVRGVSATNTTLLAIRDNVVSNIPINVNTIEGVTTPATISLFTLSTGTINFATTSLNGVITIGSASFIPGTHTGSVVINLPLTCNQNITLPANRTITLNATGGKVYCNVYTGTTVSSNLSIGESGDSGTLTIYKTTNVNNIQGTTTSSSITLFTNSSVSTPTITLGNVSGGTFSINPNTTMNGNLTLASSKIITLNATGGEVLCNTFKGTTAGATISLFDTSTTPNITLGAGLTLGAMFLGNLGNNSPRIWMYNDLWMGTTATNRTIYSNVLRSLQNSDSSSLYAFTTTGSISLGTSLTTGSVNISTSATTGSVNILNTAEASTGSLIIGSKFRQTRIISSLTYNSYWNVATGSANNIFQSPSLSAFSMPAVYTNAPTNIWSVWESNAQGEACFIAQNGETTIICNPGDQYAIHWQDEDSGGAAGFKFATDGTMSTTSDRRLKRDINPIPVGSDLLDKLSLIEYVNYKKKAPTEEKYYKNGKLRQKYQDIHKGLIAQDVKKIFPEVVEKESEYYMMKYPEVNIYFNMGVQELIKRDKEKQVIIDDLTTRLARLEQILLNP